MEDNYPYSTFVSGSCDSCGSMMMIQTGTCATCQNCGSTTGC